MKAREHDLETSEKGVTTGAFSVDSITDDDLMPDDEKFVRLTLAERIQHVVLFVSFFTLVLTGIPLLFPDSPLLDKLFFFPSSFWLRGIVHRIAGVTLMGVGIFQIGYVIASPHGNSDLRKIVPTIDDARDAIGLFVYNLGARDEKPKFGKFNFIEKFEYWALVWGVFIMGLTGVLLWFQEASIALFPIWVLDIIRIVHGFEAILAFLAIIIWHMYNVHLNPEVFPMSKVWIHGKISKEEMLEHHPLEYEAILRERREQLEIKMAKELLAKTRDANPSAQTEE
jgi:formate dehydrogenase gamma subunit